MNNVKEILSEIDENLLMADGFDEAIIGISTIKNSETVVCYDYNECVNILMKKHDMTYDDALEYMEYNVVDAYVGKKTPAFVKKLNFLVGD